MGPSKLNVGGIVRRFITTWVSANLQYSVYASWYIFQCDVDTAKIDVCVLVAVAARCLSMESSVVSLAILSIYLVIFNAI